jgi:hypothetical protein
MIPVAGQGLSLVKTLAAEHFFKKISRYRLIFNR